jgi:predicted GIY-YIG superfamily endonuclease
MYQAEYEDLWDHCQVVYLIHLETPLSGRARHYIGYTTNLIGRMHYHRTGRGSHFLAAANLQNIHY